MYFKRNIMLTIAYDGRTYEQECCVEHMLGTNKRSQSWLYFCDCYGRTGTSQCFSALRFRIGGKRSHGMLSTDGLTAMALLPDGTEREAQATATDADDLTKKEEQAIRLLQSVAKGYDGEIEVGYSGGKDSDVILHLARRSGIKILPIYHNTTIDPPGTLAHVAEVGGVRTIRPEQRFFAIVEQMGMPNRFQRHCCRFLKEWKTLDKSVMGIRKSESTKRDKQYNEPTECRYYGAKTEENHVEAIYPILYWTDEDVLNYIDRHAIRLHPLYYRKDGSVDVKRRLRCMCCPLAYYKKRITAFNRYPGMVRAYCRAAQRFLDTHPDAETVGKYQDVYQWFFREVFFVRQKKWEKWLAQNDSSLFGIRDYRLWLSEYFKVELPELSQSDPKQTKIKQQ